MRRIGGGIAVAALATLTGCAVQDDLTPDPDARIAAAKEMTQAAEAEVIGLLPAPDLRDVDQLEHGTLLSCASGHRWTGAVTVALQPGVHGSDVQVALAGAAEEHGFTVTQDELLTGRPRYELVDPDGVQLLVTVSDEGTRISVNSASPCITLPEDFRPPSQF